MERRSFLRVGVVGAAAAAFGGASWSDAFAATAQPGPSPYGPLQAADANGIMLPSNFTSRVVARTGQRVTGTNYTWHAAPDGGACFADGAGWIYTSNSEVAITGGAGSIKFDANGNITGAYRTLSATNVNCAGGATPWNTWLSCEEVDRGYVYETDPWGVKAAVRRPAMGRFKHEACAADPDRKVIYLTEDVPDGAFYRFIPNTWGDLSAGRLEVMIGTNSQTSGPVTWKQVPDVDGSPATRSQVAGTKRFNGGEGCYYAAGICWFTTKGDGRVWAYDAANSTISLTYDDSLVTSGTPPLTGVDNVTRSSGGDLFVAEDGGNMEICIITPNAIVAPFLRINGQSSSEITGPAFSPNGKRLYFSSQRGTSGSSSGGITYEVTGPFRT
ncbi:PhoX family protein [Kibdelosporangium philippinense]|uniref:PhoX family protein n=1 Tax=Kibdelosporangium philippinense TaxID=211113 RepID=A0ABS8ZPD3_9PSEU|nr:alkaline phosphatase PhoX [Kibdelosporangium philippinense]MCE7007647.1 PhoX family protein [Kibdelosporangium philippinense]